MDTVQHRELSRRVLVVDDDPEFAEALAEVLRLEPGLVVAVAYGVAAGLSAAHLGIDVALVDARMSSGGGPELARRIADELPGVAVVAMSGTGDRSSREAMTRSGAVTVVDKSDPVEVMCEAVRSARRSAGARGTEQP